MVGAGFVELWVMNLTLSILLLLTDLLSCRLLPLFALHDLLLFGETNCSTDFGTSSHFKRDSFRARPNF